MSQPPYGPTHQGTPAGGEPSQGPGGYPPPRVPLAKQSGDAGQPNQPAGQPATKPFYKRTWFIGAAAVVVLAAIGSTLGNDKAPVAAASTPTTSSSAVAPEPVTTPTPAPSSVTPVDVDFTMPSFVGLDLQSAQNQVQTHGVFFSRSHDLRGVRHQVLDSDWMVCNQNIPVGQHVTGNAEGLIDFGVVKRGESCP